MHNKQRRDTLFLRKPIYTTMRLYILPAAFAFLIATSSLSLIPANARAQKPAGPADAATIMKRKQVPILCYHQIRDWRPTDSKTSRDYIVPEAAFRAQIKMLADSGYHTISP